MTPIKIPDMLKPGIGIIHGYDGGMALYVANWKSVQMCFSIKCPEFVLRYEQYYSNPLN